MITKIDFSKILPLLRVGGKMTLSSNSHTAVVGIDLGNVNLAYGEGDNVYLAFFNLLWRMYGEKPPRVDDISKGDDDVLTNFLRREGTIKVSYLGTRLQVKLDLPSRPDKYGSGDSFESAMVDALLRHYMENLPLI